MPIVRGLIRTVVIGKTQGHQPASLQMHGDIANIMASDIRQKHHDEFVSRVKSGGFANQQEKLDFHARCKAVLAEAEADWKMLQVSVVAGAGFHLNLRSFPPKIELLEITAIARVGLFRTAA